MKLYSYFTVDIAITKSVKISAGPPFIVPWENEKKGYKMDFPHFDIITEPVDLSASSETQGGGRQSQNGQEKIRRAKSTN